MDKSRLLGKVAGKLHAQYAKRMKGTAPGWKEMSKEEKRVWTGVARLASDLLGTERFAPLLKPAGEARSPKVKREPKAPASAG